MPARTAWMWLLFGLVFLWTPAPAVAQSTLTLHPGVPSYGLDAWLRWYHDDQASRDPDSIMAKLAEGLFDPLPNGNPTFGFRRGAFWFHVRIVNGDPMEPRWLLVQEYPLSDHIDIYVRPTGGYWVHQASGDQLPFRNRAIRYRHPNFRIDLPHGEPVDLLVRVQSESSMQVPLRLFTQAAFTEQARDAQLGIGLYYGVLLALFFYNLILWASLRDASYFWYMFHIAGFGMVLFCLNGLAFEYLWPNSTWLQDRCVPVSICIAQVGMQQFTRDFLGLRNLWRSGDRLCQGMIVFFVLWGIASLFIPYRIATPVASAGVLPSVALIVAVSLVANRRGYEPARMFLFAWFMFLAGTTAFTLVAFGILPKLFFTEYGVQIGSALEMILLSFALAYRYAALRNENERIVKDANEQLEIKVEERTAELSRALDQLASANTRLQESNQRDSLTGIYNRHYFHELLERQLYDAREDLQHLAVLMIDLDHFKRINDTYGHLVGDECLRAAAARMSAVVAAHGGVLARFGGEEFVAALPGLDAAQAVAVAEEVRASVAAEPVAAGADLVKVTVSIGVHALDAYRIAGPDDALRRADEALYSAKSGGRNCVRPVLAAMDA
ncbi:sensor domain-containing diguanylate cyclase [Pseudofulvimonas gallinarii]|nr:diguanylate cyclase [Pseudofulvimonas gallinarii]